MYDEFDFDAEMDEFGACAIDDLSDDDDDDMQLLWLCGECDMSDVSELVEDPPISSDGDEVEVMGVEVKRVPGLRDAPPIDEEGSEYDPHARVDLVQNDAGPVHIHRCRGDLWRTASNSIGRAGASVDTP